MKFRYCLEVLLEVLSIDVSRERINMIEEPYHNDLLDNGNCITSDRIELVLWTMSIQ